MPHLCDLLRHGCDEIQHRDGDFTDFKLMAEPPIVLPKWPVPSIVLRRLYPGQRLRLRCVPQAGRSCYRCNRCGVGQEGVPVGIVIDRSGASQGPCEAVLTHELMMFVRDPSQHAGWSHREEKGRDLKERGRAFEGWMASGFPRSPPELSVDPFPFFPPDPHHDQSARRWRVALALNFPK